MTAIVDYGLGNLYSIANMLRHIGEESVITADRADIKLYPIQFSHVRAVGCQFSLKQFEDICSQHIRQFFPKGNIRTPQAALPF